MMVKIREKILDKFYLCVKLYYVYRDYRNKGDCFPGGL